MILPAWIRWTTGLTLTALLLGGFAGEGARAAAPVEPASREAIEQVIREYLLAHPEVIAEALQTLRAREQEVERQRVEQVIAARRKELFEDPRAPVAGNPRGDVTIVEFFDYKCGYCKAVAGTVKKVVAEDPNLRIVFKEFPILSAESRVAARAALAAGKQGKYVPFHDALMATSEALTLPTLLKIAGSVGLDTAALQRDMEAAEIQNAIDRNRTLARDLGVNATPSFVIGTQLIRGAIDYATFKEVVARARAK